jgi:AAA domain, putative AbiEii toxin, Type IV TA system
VLLRFRVTNHASIRDEQELSLIALDRHDGLAYSAVPGTDNLALPVLAIYGANASGKSNVIDALAFMRRVVIESHQRWLPGDPIKRRPFLFDEESAGRPSSFAIDFVLGSVRYEYGFTLTEAEVREEWLYTWPAQHRRILFERDAGSPVKFGASFPARRTHPVGRARKTGLLLSAGAVEEHPILLPIYLWFREGLYPALNHTFDERLAVTVREYAGPQARALRGLLEFADLGIADLDLVGVDTRVAEQMADFKKLHESMSRASQPQDPLLQIMSHLIDLNPVDELKKLDPASPFELSSRLRLAHRTRGTISPPLGLDDESSGTRTWLGLVGAVVRALHDGSVLIVDELDAHLHPHLAARLIGLFQDPATNPRGAQLVFNTHDVTLMSRSTHYRLHRDQIYFAEKETATGATSLYPLTEFARVRDGLDNIEKWYLSSRLGAVPVFLESLLDEVTETLAG